MQPHITNMIGRPTQLLINGEFVNSVSGKTFSPINPANEKSLGEYQEAGEADVDLAVKAARAALEEGPWSKYNGRQRRDLLNKLAQLFEDNADELAVAESEDNGKPVAVAKAVDVAASVDFFRYFAGWADRLEGKQSPIAGNYLCYTRLEPVGVVGQIIPWNFPLLMLAWKLAPALACGNTVVLKSSEKTPITALMAGKLVTMAGFPAGVVNILSGFGPTCGEFLVKHQDVDKIAFTGSSLVGHRISQLCGQGRLKRLTLELGGKSPLLVFDDADIDQALDVASLGLFFNNGQCCIASSRVFVQEGIYDKFVERAAARAAAQKVTDPSDPEAHNGPLVDKLQFDRVMSFIIAGKEGGARCVTGGARHGELGYFIQPTIFADVTDDMAIAREEIFGPVMSVIKFKDEAEAIKRANSTQYGLGAGVVTRDSARAIRVAHQIRAGTVYVNCYNVFDPAAPFGGFKNSGIGREHGEYGLRAYTEVKTVIINLDSPKQ